VVLKSADQALHGTTGHDRKGHHGHRARMEVPHMKRVFHQFGKDQRRQRRMWLSLRAAHRKALERGYREGSL